MVRLALALARLPSLLARRTPIIPLARTTRPKNFSLIAPNARMSPNMSLQDLFSSPHPPLSGISHNFAALVNEAAMSGSDMEQPLCESWKELIAVSATTPPEQQDPLIAFVEQLRKEPAPKSACGESCKVWGNVVEWKKLSLLGAALREAWNEVPMASESGLKAQQWVNMNAFVARLTSQSTPSNPLDFSLYGIWAMRAALEDCDPVRKMPARHSVDTACVWMLYAAEAMWERCVAEHVYDGKAAREGTSLRGREWREASKERWGVWKVRFAEIWERCEEGDLKASVERASKEMARVEGKAKGTVV